MTIKPPRGIAPGGPQVQGQPWDATDSAEVAGWEAVDDGSGPADLASGQVTGSFEDGPGPWKQT
jgi:hypothetical protein